MKANQKFTRDDEAVSPVIGVILMVAITVVLAAVVFVLVSDLGGDATVSSFPQARLSDHSSVDEAINLEHRGGDCIDLANYQFRVNGTLIGEAGSDTSQSPASGNFCVGDNITMRYTGSTPGDEGWDGNTVTVVAIQRDSQAIVYENDITL